MTTTAILQVVDRDGAALWYWTGNSGRRHVEDFRSHPAASFDDAQPAQIEVRMRHHGQLLGRVQYLEHGLDGCEDLTAVAVLDCEPEQVDGLYASAEITAHVPRHSATSVRSTLTGIACVGQTAGVAARPIRAFPGDYRYRSASSPKILERARAAHRLEQRSATSSSGLRIHRPVVDIPPERRAIRPDRVFERPRSGTFLALPGGHVGEIEYSAPCAGIISVR